MTTWCFIRLSLEL